MNQYITKFNTEAEYNTFKDSPQMPYVNASYIIETGENKFYKEIYAQQQKPFTIEILTDNGTNHVQYICLTMPDSSGTCYFKVTRNNTVYENSFDFNSGWDNCKIYAPSSLNSEFLVGDKIEIIINQVPYEGYKRDVYQFNFIADNQWYQIDHPHDLTVKVSGNIMSLFTDDYVYATPVGLGMDNGGGGFRFCSMRELFNPTTSETSDTLVDASDLFLPSRGLPDYAFREMFKGAAGLVTPPNIYAKSLGDGACFDMFFECTALTDMPIIMAQSIKGQALVGMFNGCSALVNTTTLHFNKIEGYGGVYPITQDMFLNCTSLVTAPAWDEDYEIINRQGNEFNTTFNGCSSLETCDWNIYPEDQATVSIFTSTFVGCDSLTKAPSINRGSNYIGTIYDNMFNGTYSNITELNYGKCSGPIQFNQSSFAASGTIYVADDSVYLDSSSQYYGQTPIQGWTVEAISNYPSN